MTRTIPLRAGAAFQRLRVNLAGATLRLHIYWSTRFEMFSVDIYRGDTPVTLGRGLHPGIDLLEGLNLGLGRLYFEGHPATIANLGLDNKLRHDS